MSWSHILETARGDYIGVLEAESGSWSCDRDGMHRGVLVIKPQGTLDLDSLLRTLDVSGVSILTAWDHRPVFRGLVDPDSL